jgi:hypothetical protein
MDPTISTPHPQDKAEKESFFNYFYLAINIGSLIACTCIVWVQVRAAQRAAEELARAPPEAARARAGLRPGRAAPPPRSCCRPMQRPPAHPCPP